MNLQGRFVFNGTDPAMCQHLIEMVTPPKTSAHRVVTFMQGTAPMAGSAACMAGFSHGDLSEDAISAQIHRPM